MKVTRTAALALAAHLFELEVEMIGNDTKECFEANGWLDKFGEGCLKHQDQLTSGKENTFNAAAIEKMADEIQEDFASGHWSAPKKEDGLYHYLMPTQYGGHITDALEMQLAMLTGTGVQQELNFA